MSTKTNPLLISSSPSSILFLAKSTEIQAILENTLYSPPLAKLPFSNISLR